MVCYNNCGILFICSDQQTRRHLKNVYVCLSASMLTAALGSGVHLFTDMLKVHTNYYIINLSALVPVKTSFKIGAA